MTDSSSTYTQEPVLIIEPGRTEKNYRADLWWYRELFLILAWRDISVRYKQTIIGILWAMIKPFLTMVVFTAKREWARSSSASHCCAIATRKKFAAAVRH